MLSSLKWCNLFCPLVSALVQCECVNLAKVQSWALNWSGETDWEKKVMNCSHVFHICFILTCPEPGIRIGRRLWMPEDCDHETTMYCSCTADWPLGRPSCCSSLDRDSLSTLCFAALEKMKLSTATLALMSPLSAKWITVNNAKCDTKTMTFSYQSISTFYRKYYIPPLHGGSPAIMCQFLWI